MSDLIASRQPITWMVTGVAGFIGMHTALYLLDRGDHVIGLDNLNEYYDVSLKRDRLSRLNLYLNFVFYQTDVADRVEVEAIFLKSKPNKVIHLAAQAGVRYSLKNPYEYIDSNLQGFLNILEGSRSVCVKHLVYASSSSVYGGNTTLPFSEHHNVDHPVSLYAATKKANELMAHTYSHLFKLPTTGLRFFTVYGPWGRPDMALFLFTKAILSGEPIDVFNHGAMVRDFTFIDDVVESIIRVAEKPATLNQKFETDNPDPATSNAPYRIFNIGNSKPIPVLEYINQLESVLKITAKKNFLPMQQGDVPVTEADTSELLKWIGYKPNTAIKVGIERFVNWYLNYYKI